MKHRLPLIFSVAALVVAVFGATPVGRAAGTLLRGGVPFATKAGYANRAGFAKHAKLADVATNAKLVVGHRISASPKAGDIPVLGADGKLPASLGAVGAPGVKGDKGARGDKGDKGDKGSPGVSGYQIVTVRGAPQSASGRFTVLSADCPAGKKVIGGGAEISNTGAVYYDSVAVESSYPISETRWEAVAGVPNPPANINNGTYTLTAYAICATVAP
jgi:hypothetical protein